MKIFVVNLLITEELICDTITIFEKDFYYSFLPNKEEFKKIIIEKLATEFKDRDKVKQILAEYVTNLSSETDSPNDFFTDHEIYSNVKVDGKKYTVYLMYYTDELISISGNLVGVN